MDYPDPFRWSHFIALGFLLSLCIGGGVYMLAYVVHRRLMDGKMPWAAEVPIGIGLAMIGLSVSLATIFLERAP